MLEHSRKQSLRGGFKVLRLYLGDTVSWSNKKKLISGRQCTAIGCTVPPLLLPPLPHITQRGPAGHTTAMFTCIAPEGLQGRTVPRAVHEDDVEVRFICSALSYLSFHTDQDSPQGSYHLFISCLHHPAFQHTSTHQISSKSRKWRGNQVKLGHPPRKKESGSHGKLRSHSRLLPQCSWLNLIQGKNSDSALSLESKGC